MTQFVRFTIDDATRFSALKAVFDEIKAVKNLDFATEPQNVGEQNENIDYDLGRIRELMATDVQRNFFWQTDDETDDQRIPSDKPIAISPPGAFLGAKWSIVRILDLIDSCEYSLDRCEMLDESVGELHVVTWSYPYGGLNALIALVEGFGFHIVGVNECGEYEPFERHPP